MLGFADPALGTAKAAESRRLALESGDHATLIIASWAQAAAAHARGDLGGSVRADLFETSALPELAINVFDGHLCISQRFLYGARPYPDGDRVRRLPRRRGGAGRRCPRARVRGHAARGGGTALRAAWTPPRPTCAGRRGSTARSARASARPWRCSGGPRSRSTAGDAAAALDLLDEALAVARDSDVGFHLFDRIYGARITAARNPAAALLALEEAEAGVRGPLETCPGCRITLVVPAGIAAARAGDLDRATGYVQVAEYLAAVVMRLPGWDAALDELKGHVAAASGEAARGGATSERRRTASG